MDPEFHHVSVDEKVTVMGDLEIRGLPDELLRALHRRAASKHRGAETEATVILIEALSPYIRLGSMLTEIGAGIELTDEELAAFDRDRSPPRELDL
jgi:plasmid stability protein